MADVVLGSKNLEVLYEIKELTSSSSVLDTAFFDSRVIHKTVRENFTIAADATTSVNVAPIPGKTGYPRLLLVSGDKLLRVAFVSTHSATANPNYGMDIAANGFLLNFLDNATRATLYVHNRGASTATVTVLMQQVTWTVS